MKICDTSKSTRTSTSTEEKCFQFCFSGRWCVGRRLRIRILLFFLLWRRSKAICRLSSCVDSETWLTHSLRLSVHQYVHTISWSHIIRGSDWAVSYLLFQTNWQDDWRTGCSFGGWKVGNGSRLTSLSLSITCYQQRWFSKTFFRPCALPTSSSFRGIHSHRIN